MTAVVVRKTTLFADWIDGLRDLHGRARVLARIERLAAGNPGDSAPVGCGVFEMRIDSGPGYRVYDTRRGRENLVLLAGGDKGSQRRDIALARRIAKGLQEGAMKKGARTSRYDVAEHLRTPAEMAACLEAVFDESGGDSASIAKALGDVARARGMTRVARAAGLSRESLYKALSGERSPDFATILRVMRALGMRLRAQPIGA